MAAESPSEEGDEGELEEEPAVVATGDMDSIKARIATSHTRSSLPSRRWTVPATWGQLHNIVLLIESKFLSQLRVDRSRQYP